MSNTDNYIPNISDPVLFRQRRTAADNSLTPWRLGAIMNSFFSDQTDCLLAGGGARMKLRLIRPYFRPAAMLV